MKRIGFMQGRLSEIDNGKIQSFPINNWEEEFNLGRNMDFKFIEWTLDMKNIYENPLMTKRGQIKIKQLINESAINVLSLTGDCFMQKPFWKCGDDEQSLLNKLFLDVVSASSAIKIKYIVIPLVDNGRIENKKQENYLINFLIKKKSFLKKKGVVILFESDYKPNQYSLFIKKLPINNFGINYDIGNSAALGFNPTEEFEEYGERIMNIHVKDRILNGKTVALGEGNANFDIVFSCLKQIKYKGNFIIQGARAQDGDHKGILKKYKRFVIDLIAKYKL